MRKTYKVCVITSSSKSHPAFQNIMEILKTLLSAENVTLLNIKSRISKAPKFTRQLIYILDEIVLSIKFLKSLTDEVNIVFLFQEYHLLPTFLARLLNRKPVLFIGGAPKSGSFYREQDIHFGHFFHRIIYASNIILTNLCHSLSHRIIGITKTTILKELEKNPQKTLLAPIFPNLKHGSLFEIKKQYSERERVIGFVGNFERIKGILNLADAVPLIIRKANNIHITFIGNGTYSDAVRIKLNEYYASGAVTILGSLPLKTLQNHYNNFKLLVLPSYDEGIPSVILEAMSCGTPVLATSVGGIPEIIKDSETGFLLASNNPKNIAQRIVDLLNRPKILERVSRNAHLWVKENYCEEKLLRIWQETLQQIQLQN